MTEFMAEQIMWRVLNPIVVALVITAVSAVFKTAGGIRDARFWWFVTGMFAIPASGVMAVALQYFFS